MGLPPSQQQPADADLPTDRKRLVDFDILTSLDATIRIKCTDPIVSVKWVRVIHFVRLRLERNLLSARRPSAWSCCGPCNWPLFIVAQPCSRACELPRIRSNAFPLSGDRPCGSRGNVHSGRDAGGAGPDQFAVHLHHARVAGFESRPSCG